jgi:endonuclease/exonuclease/phosphatase family metal-dependent hydrolase
MNFRVAMLNMEQDHKRWDLRRELLIEQLEAINPDIFAMNEVCIPRQTARWIQKTMRERYGRDYALVQQSRVNGQSAVEGEGLLTRLPILETGNLDYRTRDMVALVARLRAGEHAVDFYVTHQYRSRGDDSLRLYQAQQLLAWIDSRDDCTARIVCGDFNATLDMPSARLMASRLRPSQTAPTAFTPLADTEGDVSHPDRARMDRCIDFIWVSEQFTVTASEVCFDRGSPSDETLYPSDHAGVWADLRV